MISVRMRIENRFYETEFMTVQGYFERLIEFLFRSCTESLSSKCLDERGEIGIFELNARWLKSLVFLFDLDETESTV
jgi:hypothetical protein